MGKWTIAAQKRKKQIDDLLLEKDQTIAAKDVEIAAKSKQISDLKVKK